MNWKRLFTFCYRVEEQVFQAREHSNVSSVEKMRQTSRPTVAVVLFSVDVTISDTRWPQFIKGCILGIGAC